MEQPPKKPLDEIIPEWGEQITVPESDPFMALALRRIEEMRLAHPEVSNPTACAIVKDGGVVALENGGQIHESFCPRIALASPSGKEYEFCPDHCHSDNHAEARTAASVTNQELDAEGGIAYLAGHYWACMPCWEALQRVGVRKVAVLDDAIERYKNKRGALVPNQGKLQRPLRIFIDGSFDVEDQTKLVSGLRAVGFEIIARQANPGPEVTLVLPGGTPSTHSESLVVDASTLSDYRLAITRLSQATEPLFNKVH